MKTENYIDQNVFHFKENVKHTEMCVKYNAYVLNVSLNIDVREKI